MKKWGLFLFDIGGCGCIVTFLKGGSFIIYLIPLILGVYMLVLDWSCQREPEEKDKNWEY